jgi:hypothetical protein
VAQRGIRVLVKEVPQRRDEVPGMRNIVPANRCTDVIDEHVPDVVRSVLAVEQRSAEHHRYSIGNMLVLGNGVNLVRREIAKADQVFETDHRSLRPLRFLGLWVWAAPVFLPFFLGCVPDLPNSSVRAAVSALPQTSDRLLTP